MPGVTPGLEPEAFTARVREFMARARHRTLGRPFGTTVYQPMLELLKELRRHRFTIFLVSGGGTEFVRAISSDLYAVAPEAVFTFRRNGLTPRSYLALSAPKPTTKPR